MAKLDDDTLFDSLKDGISRRFNDPIISTFTASFIITNYEIVIWLFSENTADVKISKIKEILYTFWAWLTPLAITIFLFGLPFLIYKIYEKAELSKVLLKNARSNAEKKLISVELELHLAEQRIRDEIERTNEAQNAVAKKSEEIGFLNKTIEDLKLQISTNNLPSLAGDNPEIVKTLKLLEKKNLIDSFTSMAADATTSYAWASNYNQAEVVALKTIGVIKLVDNNNNEKYIILTELGDQVYRANLYK